MIDRRTFLAGAGVVLIVAPLAAEAQEAGKIARIGFLTAGALGPATLDAFRQGLRERGYVEGQNILIEYRAADGKLERLPGLATELVRLKVDLIVAGATPAARAAQQATTTIPIVATAMGDPVEMGSSPVLPGLEEISQGRRSSARNWFPSGWSSSRKRSPRPPVSPPCCIPALLATAR